LETLCIHDERRGVGEIRGVKSFTKISLKQQNINLKRGVLKNLKIGEKKIFWEEGNLRLDNPINRNMKCS